MIQLMKGGFFNVSNLLQHQDSDLHNVTANSNFSVPRDSRNSLRSILTNQTVGGYQNLSCFTM